MCSSSSRPSWCPRPVQVVYTVDSNTVLEATWGLTQGNQLGNVPNSPSTNRNAVGLGNFPTLYPNNGMAREPVEYSGRRC